MIETILKIGGVLVIPLILALLNNWIAKLKHDREAKAESLKLAADFESPELNKRSILYKDRLAKSLFNNDALTYGEAKFFSNYENADLWIKQYTNIRKLVRRERNDLGEIIDFKPKYKWYMILAALVGYFLLAGYGLSPFYKFNVYVAKIVGYYEKDLFLNILIGTVPYVMALVAGFLCLKYIERCADCGIFLHDIKHEAFKVPELVGPSENPPTVE
jgi:hypothetical protein